MSGRDTNFYYSFLVLPAEKRRAIVAVWDFCRAVDDAVDEAPAEAVPSDAGGAASQLAWWREELAACYGQGPPRSPQGAALAPFIPRFSLPRDAFDAVIDGVAMDLERSRYQTFDELREYCLRVASAVGLLCIEIFGYTDPRHARLRPGPRHRPAADQHHPRRRHRPVARAHLPARSRISRASAARKTTCARASCPTACGACSRYECARAGDYYEKAERELPRADRRRMVAARIMAGIYHAILDRIERSGYDVFGRTSACRAPAARSSRRRSGRGRCAGGRTGSRLGPEQRALELEPMMFDVAVIGGGLAGLSAAARLAAAGARVLVAEARPGARRTGVVVHRPGHRRTGGQRPAPDARLLPRDVRVPRRVGAGGNVRVQAALEVPFVDRTGRRTHAALPAAAVAAITCSPACWNGTRSD